MGRGKALEANVPPSAKFRRTSYQFGPSGREDVSKGTTRHTVSVCRSIEDKIIFPSEKGR